MSLKGRLAKLERELPCPEQKPGDKISVKAVLAMLTLDQVLALEELLLLGVKEGPLEEGITVGEFLERARQAGIVACVDREA